MDTALNSKRLMALIWELNADSLVPHHNSLTSNCEWIIFSFKLHYHPSVCCLASAPRQVVLQPAHTLALKRFAARERAALFTDLPQMRVELWWGQLAEYQSMPLSALSTAVAVRAGVLCCVLFMVMSAQALAQTSATDNPGPTAAQTSVPAQEQPAAAAEEKPPTADDKAAAVDEKPAPAEEKPAIAQDKPAAVEDKSAATDDKPAIAEEKPVPAEAKPAIAQDKPASVEEKSAAADSNPAVVEQKPAVAEQKPAVALGKPASKQKSAAKQSKTRSKEAEQRKQVQPAGAARKPRERTLAMICTRFRTYDPSSGTYRGYDGQTHSCRQATAGAATD